MATHRLAPQQHQTGTSGTRLPHAYSDELKQEQLQALDTLAICRDPYFTVHRAMHALKARVIGEKSIPLGPSGSSLECSWFSDCAAVTLRRLFHIERENLFQVQLGKLLPNLDITCCGNHVILYVKDGLKYLPGSLQGDVFFDSTCSQFSRRSWDSDRKERVSEYLNKHGGTNGSAMADALLRRGYVKVPAGDAGRERLGLLLAAYASKEFWIKQPGPIEQAVLYNPKFDARTEGESYFERHYKEVQGPRDPNSYYDGWSSAEHFFDPGTRVGELRLDHPEFEVEYFEDWSKGDI